MDDTNIFEIDSDELRELKEIAKTIESPPHVTQQEQKVVYQTAPARSPLKSPIDPKDTKKDQPEQPKPSKVYKCVCNSEYYVEGWFLRHQKKCAVLKLLQRNTSD